MVLTLGTSVGPTANDGIRLWGLLLAHKSARPALSIKLLTLDVINALMKIEPDDSVVRAVLLGGCMACVACNR
jgi:hypothetical protein